MSQRIERREQIRPEIAKDKRRVPFVVWLICFSNIRPGQAKAQDSEGPSSHLEDSRRTTRNLDSIGRLSEALILTPAFSLSMCRQGILLRSLHREPDRSITVAAQNPSSSACPNHQMDH